MSTISDAVTQVRQIVQDNELPYRHTEAKLYAYFNSAINDTKRIRADLFIPNVGTVPPAYDELDGNLPFPLDLGYFTAVVDYVVGRVGLEDDEFANDGRAMYLQQLFMAKLTGKNG